MTSPVADPETWMWYEAHTEDAMRTALGNRLYDWLERKTSMSTKPYRPSNGTEGMRFQAQFCERCTREGDWRKHEYCEILSNTMAFKVTEEGYPKEWVIEDGKPKCTAFDPVK